MPHANTTTTLVRTAVARFESMCATPTLASRAVAAAKTAESSAHPIQLMGTCYAGYAGRATRVGKLYSNAWRPAAPAKPPFAWPFAAPRTSWPIRRRFSTIRLRLRLVGSGFARDLDRAMEKVARDFRAFMAARSRYVEDRLADAVGAGR